MKHLLIDEAGDLLCPVCGSKQMSYRRTRGARIALGVTAGVGALAAPKRMQCLGCKEYLKGPPEPAPRAVAPARPSAGTPAGSRAASTAESLDLTAGDVPVVVTESKWLGPAMVSMLNSAYPGLPPGRRHAIRGELAAGRPVELARMSAPATAAMARRLESNGFKTEPLAPQAPAPADDPGAAALAPFGDPIEMIEKLAALHAAGVLSDDEFQAKKAELLHRL